ncbi:hypothetical protein ALC57_11209, partial [Trachymyrmex cornetzi]
SNHIEPRRFLEDASEIVLERVQCIMQRYSMSTLSRRGLCLHYFDSSAKLEMHSEDCEKINDYAIRLPSKDDKWLSFRNHCRKERVPFVVYADLECVATGLTRPPTDGVDRDVVNHPRIGILGQNAYDATTRRSESLCLHPAFRAAAHTFRNSTHKPYHFTRNDWEKFNSVSHCHVCEKPFTSDDTRVRDHCHLVGRYRGPAHSNCNLNYRDSRCIPVVFHNLSGYDTHFIIKEIVTVYEGRVDLLPITKEKYISFTKHVDSTKIDQKNCMQLRFIDSYRFLASSLYKLSSFLNNDKLLVLRREFSHLSEENFNLLTRKYVFRYEYIDCSEKLNELRLPSRELFYSSLTDSTVSESHYAHAVNVWQRFSILTLGEYSDLYLKTDVLLLADVFENLRDSCIASYGLDPAYYYTLPGFIWDAMLKLDSQTGYIFEVDLEYPQHLHDAHIDLPFCPTREKPPGKRDDKLLATLCDKQRYVIHYRNLQQCTHHGLRIAKIHRILQFAQFPSLRDYIELNTKFRTMAKNDFEKNLYKLMNNAVFGKTMENVRDLVDVEGRYGAEAMIAKPNFHSRSVFSENLVAIELRKLEVKFDKPIYVGMCILDISKTCLYEFHHEYMAPVFREKCKIMYTDTDNLIYHVECDDIYDMMKRDINRFDTSDYAVDNAHSIPLTNKKVPGLMKDEKNGAIMTEFVRLRAKMYALRVQGKKDAKKAKDVKSSVVAKSITFENYTCCLNDAIEMTRRQSCIRSKLHEVYPISETKIALNPHDDKRYIVSGSTDTLPWGHY